MLALVAAVLFVVGALARGFEWSGHAGDFLIWLFLGLAAFALHHAYPIGMPRATRPPQ